MTELPHSSSSQTRELSRALICRLCLPSCRLFCRPFCPSSPSFRPWRRRPLLHLAAVPSTRGRRSPGEHTQTHYRHWQVMQTTLTLLLSFLYLFLLMKFPG